MWHSALFSLVIFFLTASNSWALSVSGIVCTKISATSTDCRVQLEGEVQPGDSLMISEVQDMDSLYFENTKLGSTGLFAGRKFYAAYIPRVYPLDLIEKKNSPSLSLHIESVFSKEAKIPKNAQIKIVSAATPLRKILVRPFALFLEFAFLAGLSIFVFFGLRRGISDGWNYSRHELRSFLISTFAYLLFHTEFLRSISPWLVKPEFFQFMSHISPAVMMWASSRLLLEGKFVDRSCVERGYGKKIPSIFLTFSNLALLFPLLIFTFQTSSYFPFALLFLSSAMALYASATSLEWRRIAKRSPTGSFLFHLSLMAISLFLPLTELIRFSGSNGSEAAKALSALCLFTATWRMLRYQQAKGRGMELVEEARAELSKFYRGEERVQTLCDLIEGEWGFSRVSLISVQEGQGLVLASSGPDAIPFPQRHLPRKLGPFLRRVCKEGHMLYAPVAEELGKDLQDKGLKHSSLGIPLLQENRVVAVLCVMAEEDERIPPYDAMVIDLIIQTIRLEIVSAVLQSIAEERNERIISVARVTGGLVLEHIDSWGRLHQPKEVSHRSLVAAEISDSEKMLNEISSSSILYHSACAYRAELRDIWFSLRSHFEFLSKDIRADDFWAISPAEFKQPALREIGQEAVALLLAYLLEKHARNLAQREDYAALGVSGAKVAAGKAKLHFVPLGKQDVFGMDIQLEDFIRVKDLRASASPGDLRTEFNSSEFHCPALRVRSIPIDKNNTDKEINFSILHLSIDMKEIRKIEFAALEFAKNRKKSA